MPARRVEYRLDVIEYKQYEELSLKFFIIDNVTILIARDLGLFIRRLEIKLIRKQISDGFNSRLGYFFCGLQSSAYNSW